MLRAVTPARTHFSAEDAAFRVYAVLSRPQRDALWEAVPVRFAYPPERGCVGLDETTAADVVAGRIGNTAHHDTGRGERSIPVPFNGVERVRGELALAREGGRVRFTFRARYLGSFGQSSAGARRTEGRISGDVRLEDPTEVPAETVLEPGAAALRERVTLPGPAREPEEEQPVALVGDFLARLAPYVPYTLVADAYYGVGLHGYPTARERPLAEVLTDAADLFELTCRRSGPYLLFRDRDWARLRPTQPPASLARRWAARLRAAGGPSMRDLEEMAVRLTEDQAGALLFRWELGRDVPAGRGKLVDLNLGGSHSLLRLLATLQPSQRRALEAGRPMRLGDLPPPAVVESAALAVAHSGRSRGYLYEGGRDEEGRPVVLGSTFGAEDHHRQAWPEAELSLRRTPTVWTTLDGSLYLEADLRDALSVLRERDPKATERDLPITRGERVDVEIRWPGRSVKPLAEYFLVLPGAAAGIRRR